MLSSLTHTHTPQGDSSFSGGFTLTEVAQSAQGQGTKEKCLLCPQKEVGPWSFFHILVPLPCIPIFNNSFTMTDGR